jgi:ribosomal protein S18 acetylase RimI-like enzyme
VLDIAALGHLNLLESCRELTRWSPAGRLEERDGVLLCASGSSLPVRLNVAMRLHDDVDPALLLDAADGFFARLGRGYTVLVRDVPADKGVGEACEAAGLLSFGTSPEMACRARLPEVEGLDVRPVADVEAVAEFVRVSAEAYGTYGMPAEAAYDTFADAARIPGAPHIRAVVAYDDGEPVAAALVLLSHGIAGVYWVGTVERARRRGFGEAVTRIVTNVGFDLGAACCTLQASTMGESVYARMGYETLYTYTSWVRPAS